MTSLAAVAGLYQDFIKPVQDRLSQSAPSTSWYVGSWRIDIDRTVASIPKEAAFAAELESEFRSALAQARVEIGSNAGRILGPSGFYSREQRGTNITEQELLSVIDFTVTPSSDKFALPTLVPPSVKRIAAGTPSMSGIHRTSSGIFIEGDGVTTRDSEHYADGTQRLTEKAYTMRIYLVRVPP